MRRWGLKIRLRLDLLAGCDRSLPQIKRLILVSNLRTHADNPIMAIDHMEIDLHGDLLTRSDDRDLDRVFVCDSP